MPSITNREIIEKLDCLEARISGNELQEIHQVVNEIKEILLALRIENILTKDQILELYLNDIYLGKRSYGIASASLNYFNKSLSELNLDGK